MDPDVMIGPLWYEPHPIELSNIRKFWSQMAPMMPKAHIIQHVIHAVICSDGSRPLWCYHLNLSHLRRPIITKAHFPICILGANGQSELFPEKLPLDIHARQIKQPTLWHHCVIARNGFCEIYHSDKSNVFMHYLVLGPSA